jgi:hypothetical protein
MFVVLAQDVYITDCEFLGELFPNKTHLHVGQDHIWVKKSWSRRNSPGNKYFRFI